MADDKTHHQSRQDKSKSAKSDKKNSGKIDRELFKPIYVAHNKDDLKLIITYLQTLIEFLERKIRYYGSHDFYYWNFKKFKIRSFSLTQIKRLSRYKFICSYERELMDVVRNLDYLSTKYDAHDLAYPHLFEPNENDESK